MGHRAGCRVGSTKSVPVPRRRPRFTWRPFCTLAGPGNTHRARRRLSSSSNSNSVARRPSRAAQDMARGCAAAGWQQVTATNTGPQDPQPNSPKGPHSRGLAGKRGMETEEREGRGGRAVAEGRRGDWGRRAPGGDGRGQRGGDWTGADQGSLPATFRQTTVPSPSPRPALFTSWELKPLKTSPCPQTSL